MPDETPAYQDRETLRRLFYDEGLAYAEIAEQLEAPVRTVAYWMDRHGLAPGRAGRTAHGRRLLAMDPDEVGTSTAEGERRGREER